MLVKYANNIFDIFRPLLSSFFVFTLSAQFTDKETELERFWYFKLGIVRGYSRDKEPGQGRWDQSDDTVRGELGNKREDILRVLRTWPNSVFMSILVQCRVRLGRITKHIMQVQNINTLWWCTHNIAAVLHIQSVSVVYCIVYGTELQCESMWTPRSLGWNCLYFTIIVVSPPA